MRQKAAIITHEYRYTVLFHPAERGGYLATCPALPGLVAAGNSLPEARLSAADAIRSYLEILKADGIDFPIEYLHPYTEQVHVAIEVP
jgi:predicted RNase H-like HicB family nuclease